MQKSLRHTTMFTYSDANTPLGQSERAYYLSYFIIPYIAIYYHVLPCITMYCHCDTSETELSSTMNGKGNLPLNFNNSTMVHVQVSEVVEILELKKMI